jgi:hypothetical protein
MSGELEPVPQTTDQARRGPVVAAPVMTPEFVMVGVRLATDQVLLFASMTLTDAELRKELKGIKRVPIFPGRNSPVAKLKDERISVVAEMQDYTQIIADSYPAAMQTLQEQWSRRQAASGNALPPGI